MGNPGARSDGGVFAEDNLGAALRQGKLDLPPPRVLPRDKKVSLAWLAYSWSSQRFSAATHLHYIKLRIKKNEYKS